VEASAARLQLELLRANLFRGERLLASAQPRPCLTQNYLFQFPAQEVPVLLETLQTAQRCLEEWLESETCRAILGKDPTLPALRAR
jgi:hypothetical protein